MNIKILKANFETIKEMLLIAINEHASHFDSFLEDHILKSSHYEILADNVQVGYFSIFEKNLLTQFYVDVNYRYLSQELFDKVKRYEQVYKAFVATGDEFFLTHVLDCLQKIELQAYFFKDTKVEFSKDMILNDLSLKLATEVDIELIQEKSGDFFDDVVGQVHNHQIFIGIQNKDIVSFGIIEKSKLYHGVASIGMFTVAEKRNCGIGRITLIKLKEACYRDGITPIAGCWYYNHESKRTLQGAGMVAQSRLIVAKF